MYALYTTVLAVGLLLTLPYWLARMARHAKNRAGLWARLGRVPPHLQSVNPRVIWVHAVSVGEVMAVSRLVEGLRQSFPGHRVVVSTTTLTGQQLAQKQFGRDNVFYFPLDLPFAVRPYLDALQPQLLIVAETEFWPNVLRMSKARGARIVIVNARISDRSLPGYRRVRRWLARVLQNVDLFLTQTWEDRHRLVELGAEATRVEVTGNLKFEIALQDPPAIVAQLRQSLQEAGGGPVLVCGSTLEGEETLLLSAFRNILASHPRAVMVLAPRHPERFAEVASLLQELDFRYWRRSTWKDEPVAGGVFLLDSIGELAALYALATVAFVGGSLVPKGGHNILEPAYYAVPIIVGNHTENFRDIVWLFQTNQAVRIVGPAELPLVVMELLADETECRELGERGRQVLRSQMGATDRTLEALRRLMEDSPTASASVTP